MPSLAEALARYRRACRSTVLSFRLRSRGRAAFLLPCRGMANMPSANAAPSGDAQHAQILHREAGLHRNLTPRQLSMIALGGAIGTGLFLGSAISVQLAGPG